MRAYTPMINLKPRWKKVLRDLFANRTRTVLVVLSIAVGVFAVGAVQSSQDILTREMERTWSSTQAASARISLSGFDQDFVDSIQRMPEIVDAEGRQTTWGRVTGAQETKQIEITGIRDFEAMRINKVFPEQADRDAWPPPKRQILLERNSMAFLGVGIGDSIELELNSKKYTLRVAGTAYNPDEPGPTFMQNAAGFVTLDTMEWMGQSRQFGRLLIRVTPPNTFDHVQEVSDLIKDRVQKNGWAFYGASISRNPGKHPITDAVQSILLIMSVLGVLSLIMSGFLVINTVSSVLMEQVRQIGMMKAVGARNGQLTQMYLVMVLAFGALSLFVAMPLGALGARGFVDLMAWLLNLNIRNYSTPMPVMFIEIAIGLIAPTVAALQPVISGTRKSVREAISDYGIGNVSTIRSQSRLGRVLTRLNPFAARWAARQADRANQPTVIRRGLSLSRPVVISLRNTFRRKGRLMLTMATLILGGAIFIGVFSVRESLIKTLDVALAYWNYDVEVNLATAYPSDQLERAAMSVPGVVKAEAWGYGNARRLNDDRSEGSGMFLVAPPANTELLRPILLRGRWLTTDDQDAIVINSEVTQVEEDLDVGSTVTLKVNGASKHSFKVVGVAQGVLTGRIGYINKPYFANKVVMSGSKAENLQVKTLRSDQVYEDEVASAIKEEFKRANIKVASTTTTASTRVAIMNQFNVIIVFLLAMAVLIAVVGGLGLAGTMSINVLERTREIGVMRAIGASNGSVRQIVVVEGVLIGILSGLIGAALAVPISLLLSNAIGTMLLREPLFYTFGWLGLGIWFALVVIIATLASVLPAMRAARLTVREVLAYA